MKQRILVISLQGIGNTVLLLPLLNRIGKEATLSLVLSDNGSNRLLENNPNVQRIYSWRERDSGWANIRRLGGELRSIFFDVSCAAQPNWMRENAVNWLCRSRQKLGLSGGHKRLVLDRLLCRLNGYSEKVPSLRHDLASNLSVFGLSAKDIDWSAPNLFFTNEECRENQGCFGNTLLDCSGISPFLVGIHPGANGIEKWWEVEKFAEVARGILRTMPVTRFLIFGARQEAPVMRALQSAIGPAARLAEGLSLRQSAWLIGKCRLFLGNDSAPAHIAGISGVATVVMFGPTNPERIAPIGANSVIVRKDYPCSPCSDKVTNVQASCAYGLRCIRQMTAGEVLPIIERYIESLRADKQVPVGSAGLFDGLGGVRVETMQSGALTISLPPGAPEKARG